MSISEVGNNSDGDAGSVSITHGIDIQENDFVLVAVFGNNNGHAWSDNNGSFSFTEALQENNYGISATYALFYRIAGASEPSSYSFDYTHGTAATTITIRVFRGVDTSNPFDVTPSVSTRTVSSGTTLTAPTMTTLTNGALGILHNFTDSDTITFSNPTNGYGSGAQIVWRCQCSYTRAWASAGATGTSSADLSSSDDWCAHQFALKPEAVADTFIPMILAF